MDNINRIISFILGLVVVAIFLVILSGRLNLGKRLFTASRGEETTPTPTISLNEKQLSATPFPTERLTSDTRNATASATSDATSIPATGPGLGGMMVIATSLGGGILLRLRSRS